MVGGNQTIARSKIAPWLALGFVLVLVLGLGAISSGAIVLESLTIVTRILREFFGVFFESIFFSTFHSAFCIIFFIS